MIAGLETILQKWVKKEKQHIQCAMLSTFTVNSSLRDEKLTHHNSVLLHDSFHLKISNAL